MIVLSNASERGTGGINPVFAIDVSNTESEQNFLTLIELIVNFFPVMNARASKNFPIEYACVVRHAWVSLRTANSLFGSVETVLFVQALSRDWHKAGGEGQRKVDKTLFEQHVYRFKSRFTMATALE